MVKTLYDYIKANESDEAIDPEWRETVESCSKELAEQWQLLAKKMQPGSVVGDIWELVRPSATKEEKDTALERLADSGAFKYASRKFNRLEILATIINATNFLTYYEEQKSRKELVLDQTPRESLRVLKNRLEDELEEFKTGKGRADSENEAYMPDDLPGRNPDIESLILVRESLEHFRASNPYLAAVIEAELLRCNLREIAEKHGLAYSSVKKAKLRNIDKLKIYFS